MKAIVHIGMPKAGSTAIQSWLLSNRASLNDQGFFYGNAHESKVPGSARNYTHTCAELLFGVYSSLGKLTPKRSLLKYFGLRTLEEQHRFTQDHHEYFSALVAANQDKAFVISSELFAAHLRKPKLIRLFIKMLGTHFDDITYVLYFRRQEEFIPSSFAERLKRGSTPDLQQMVYDDPRLDYFATAQLWEKCVGRENLLIRLFEKDAFQEGDLFADFAQTLGINPRGFVASKRENRSPSAATLKILNAINAPSSGYYDDQKKLTPLGRRVMKELFALDAQTSFDKLRLTDDQINTIRDHCKNSNEKLRATYFPERAELFPEREFAAPNDPSDLAAQVAELSTALVTKLHTNDTPSVSTPRLWPLKRRMRQ